MGEPLFLANAQHFESAEALRATLAGEREGWVYSRRSNPTVRHLEETVAALEGYQVDAEVGAAIVATGMAAVTVATTPFISTAVGPAPNIVASSACYGSTVMVFNKRYGAERGVTVRWIRDPLSLDEWERAIDDDTRFLYAESPSNPTMELVDIRALGALARGAGIPLIVDSTLATPVLVRPLGIGADVVVHSLTKAAGASGRSMGGAVIARRDLHARSHSAEMTANFASYLREGLIRDTGCVISPFNAWTILSDIRELWSRVDVMSTSALAVAEHLAASPRIAEVFYPGLASHRSHAIATRDMWLVDSNASGRPGVNRFGFMLCFRPVGGVAAALAVMDRLELIWRANNLGQVKSTATIPAIATHKQIADSYPGLASTPPDMIRLSVGLEHVDDIIEDLDRAIEAP